MKLKANNSCILGRARQPSSFWAAWIRLIEKVRLCGLGVWKIKYQVGCGYGLFKSSGAVDASAAAA